MVVGFMNMVGSFVVVVGFGIAWSILACCQGVKLVSLDGLGLEAVLDKHAGGGGGCCCSG